MAAVVLIPVSFFYVAARPSAQKPIRDRDLKALRVLLDQNPKLVSQKDWSGGLPLHVAVEVDALEMVGDVLLSKGANIDEPQRGGFTPLHVAVEFNRTNAAKWLLNKGAKIDSKTTGPSGYTPLYLAVKTAHLEMAELLLSRGANPDAGDDLRYTPRKAVLEGQIPPGETFGDTVRRAAPHEIWKALFEKHPPR